eukprot:gnl/Dysnectes_brevis/2768_a3372_694.p1 GENE.gnl/Dysnectes_brevis/2768_a3372_694~~gnl/Dysnectes_brevis/2768_a3372_694.p1  ORF type:complete len:333 (+),score=23.11 gnl/Dysnectes_brevis/2768_a3372_694:86-1084(+)
MEQKDTDYVLEVRDLNPTTDLPLLDLRTDSDADIKHVPSVHISWTDLKDRMPDLPPRHFLPYHQEPEPSIPVDIQPIRYIAPSHDESISEEVIHTFFLIHGYYSVPHTVTDANGGWIMKPHPRTSVFWQPCPALKLLGSIEIDPTSPPIALDVGCGSGRECVWLASRGWKVVGLERSKRALRHSTEMFKRTGYYGTIDLIGGNIRTTAVSKQLKDMGPFDLVLVSRFPYTVELFTFLTGLLRIGGQFVYHQFHISAASIAGKPRKQLCLDPSAFLPFAAKPICAACASRADMTEGCARRRAGYCGLGLDHRAMCLTVGEADRHMFNYVGVRK